MSGIHLSQMEMLLLLWVLPLFLGLTVYAAHRRRQALEQFARADLLKDIGVEDPEALKAILK